MDKYDHTNIEKKWQEEWEKSGIYRADDASSKEKRYVLDMFPYPSGAGLHTGHVEGYTATDVSARFMRMQGFNVMHPMGFDSFGLPAENYAIKTGVHPSVTTEEAIGNFTKQMKSLGFSYDWSRELAAHRPDYYKWTQWFFLLMYQNGLAEKKKAKVNWCPNDQTVLANEQVVDGKCERCGAEVVQKDLEQWFFKITKYADQLIEGLDTIDWPESTKSAQRNWIGRNYGVRYSLKVKDTDFTVETYSTHFEAFWADTFAVIAPDHPRLAELIGDIRDRDAILARAREITNERERSAYGADLAPEGVFTGRYLLDPITNAELPLWVANYALAEYGTGIVKCSAHDQRDFAFAKKYDIPLRVVLLPDDASLVEKVNAFEVCFADFDKATLLLPKEFAGKRPHAEREAILQYLEKKNYGTRSTQYRLRDWLVSRQRYWGAPIPIVYDPEGNAHPIPEKHLPWTLPTDVEFKPTGVSPLGQSKELQERVEKIFGAGWRPEIDTMDTFVCSSWYYYRFADPKNLEAFASKEQIEKWLPVDLYVGGAEHTVLHLLYARFFTKVLKDLGYISFDEPFQKLRHQGMILAEDGRKMSKSLGNVVNPDDVVAEYGADTLRLYEMFMGPLEVMKPWNTKNIVGCARFLERVWKLQANLVPESQKEMETSLNRTIKKMGEDLEQMKFNTAIAALMIAINDAEKFGMTREQYAAFVQILAPLAPHMSEELWHVLGNMDSVHLSKWPTYDESKLVEENVTIAVQVNGKTRATVSVPTGSDEGAVRTLAEEAAGKWLHEGSIAKVIFVQDRLISFVLTK